MPDDDIRLLALDGGGVRGLSSLMILRNLMTAVNADAPPKPCDYFDMIGGTSTGGLIAIMLGRLCMSVDDCIAAYASLSDKVFEKKSHRVSWKGQLRGRFDSRALEQAIRRILVDTGYDENTLLKDTSHTCRVIVCATSKETGDTVCLTSYRSPRSTQHLLESTRIWEACRATSAATTFFEPIAIGSFGEQFVDGALGANNPVFALWSQAQDIWGDGLQGSLRCLVSIGTGVPALKTVRNDLKGIWSTLRDLATETERTAERFLRDKAYLDDGGCYFRFNVERGLENIGLEESKRKPEIAAATGRTPFSLQGVPLLTRFVARPSDTESLEKCLLPGRPGRKGRTVFVLHGLGGVGKTQLAADFARRHQDAFSSVFWLDGRSEDQLKRSIARCVDRIPEGQIPTASRQKAKGRSQKDLDVAAASVMEWLGRPDNCHWLLVFDNVDLDYEQEQDGGSGGSASGSTAASTWYDVKQYLPWDHGSVLITTRVSRLEQLAEPGDSCKLAKVDGRLGRAILETCYGGELGPDADGLLEVLDGLPLALAQAASYLRETRIGVAEYLDIYRHQWVELMGTGSSRPLHGYEQGSIATTWTVSFRQIEKKSGAAANLLRLWAFLDNKHLWHGLLAAAAVKGSVQWPLWLSKLAANKVHFLAAVRLLHCYSMIEAQEGAREGYSMHPVVHLWASYLDGGSHKAEYAWLALMTVGLSVPATDEKEYWIVQQQLLPHAARCTEWMRSGLLDATSERIDTAKLYSMHKIGYLYANQGRLGHAEETYRRALAGKEKALRPDYTSTLDTVNNLGILYVDQGRLGHAEEMFRRALAGKEKALGPDHTSTLDTVNNLGNLYVDQGRLGHAEEMYRRALAGYEKAFGHNRSKTQLVLRNLGEL